MEDLAEKISTLLLPAVHSPAQYIAGEINQVRKDPAAIEDRKSVV